MCPFCGGDTVTFCTVRNIYHCDACKILGGTPSEYARWHDPSLPLNDDEFARIAAAPHPAAIIAQRLVATLRASRQADEEMSGRTYQVNHSPNCHRRYAVRLVGRRRGKLDGLPPGQTQDLIGYGDSFAEAALAVLALEK